MAIWQKIKKSFVYSSADITIADVLLFIADYVENREAIRDDITKIEGIARLDAKDQNKVAEDVYFHFEKILCPAKFSVKELRTNVADRFDMHYFRLPFAAMFLPEREQGVLKLEYAASDLTEKLLVTVGAEPLKKFIHAWTTESILLGTKVDDAGRLDFSLAEERFFMLPPAWLKLVEQSLELLNKDLSRFLTETTHITKSVIPLTPAAQKMLTDLGMANLVSKGIVQNLEKELVTKKGGAVSVVVAASALRDSAGHTFGAVITVKDLTWLRRMEEEKRMAVLKSLSDLKREKEKVDVKVKERTRELAAEKDKIETIVRSMGDGLMVIDPSGKIILWNSAAAQLTGWNDEEVVGRYFQDILKLVSEKDRTSNNDFINAAIKEKVVKSMEGHTLLIRKDGTEVSVADSAAPIVDAKGNMLGVTVVFRDVTKEREVERIKTDFIAIASHEMRTPLTLIKGFAERLLRTVAKKKDKKSVEMVSSIYRNSDRLFNIVNDFLDVISLEEKRMSFLKAPFDLTALVQETVSELQRPAEDKSLYLRFEDVAAPIPMVMSDKNRVKQVLINLVSNAIHYTEKGGISVVLKKEKDSLIVSVRDTGIGIPKEGQALLFKKFSTIQKTFLHSKEYGSGLGLYISKLIVESMDGRIWLEESSPEHGSVFSFSLPVGS